MWVWYVALGVVGITQGMAGSLCGVLLPVLYGTVHLGAIRSLTTTIMVISTPIGSGITGVLIDAGVHFQTQILLLGLWCPLIALLCWGISRRLRAKM